MLNENSTMTVALVGNLSDGYGAVGPYKDFDAACADMDGREAWIMTMQRPDVEYDDPQDADKWTRYLRQAREGATCCPNCGSHDLGIGELDAQLTKIYRPMVCASCSIEWTETFTITNVEPCDG